MATTDPPASAPPGLGERGPTSASSTPAGAGTEPAATGDTSAGAGAPSGTHREPKRLREIASDLWHQKAGTREQKSGGATRALSAKEVVNGLERKELALGVVAAALDLVLTVSVFYFWHHSSQAKFRHYAPEFLVAGLIGVAILAAGTAFFRRALVGFASFMVGMELISFGLVYGILYLFFGGWLIVRVMRKQKQDQARGTYAGTIDTGTKQRRTTSGPKPSKRYTPPRRTSAAARRR